MSSKNIKRNKLHHFSRLSALTLVNVAVGAMCQEFPTGLIAWSKGRRFADYCKGFTSAPEICFAGAGACLIPANSPSFWGHA